MVGLSLKLLEKKITMEKINVILISGTWLLCPITY